MNPITKIWLCNLKSEDTIKDQAFLRLWSDILELCSSYTNPNPGSPPMHVVYHSTQDPMQIMMITGYQSQELNTECDKVYATKYLPRMFEFVTHVWLRQLDVDVRSLPVDQERVVVACGNSQLEGMGGSGGWDVWQATSQAKENENDAQGVRKDEGDAERLWVQISGSVSPGDESGKDQIDAREIFRLKKLMGR